MAVRRAAALFAAVLTALAAPANAHVVELTNLPLRDGFRSDHPEKGSVFACQTRFNPNAPGAQAGGDWLDEEAGTFDLTAKPTVDGAVMHVSELEIGIVDGARRITGNALPNHPTGVFPVSRDDDAFPYDRNPNSIRAHRFTLDLPVDPQAAETPQCAPMGAIGIMLSGSVLFNALDARGKDALAHEILDACQGHPQQSGLYHYHGKTPCLDDGAGQTEHAGLIGYAFDGYGIYGFRDEDGRALTSDDLDDCHGHEGPVTIDGALRIIYHYHATLDYPYTLSCYHGAPVDLPAALTDAQPRGGPPPRP